MRRKRKREKKKYIWNWNQIDEDSISCRKKKTDEAKIVKRRRKQRLWGREGGRWKRDKNESKRRDLRRERKKYDKSIIFLLSFSTHLLSCNPLSVFRFHVFFGRILFMLFSLVFVFFSPSFASLPHYIVSRPVWAVAVAVFCPTPYMCKTSCSVLSRLHAWPRSQSCVSLRTGRRSLTLTSVYWDDKLMSMKNIRKDMNN